MGMGKRRGGPVVVCPDPAHAGSNVVSHGRRVSKTGVRLRLLCTPLVGDRHRFSVLIAGNGIPLPTWSPPPACAEHPAGRVVRDGLYASSTPRQRQRYRCYPGPGEKPHRFTPPLPREHVHAGEDSCVECEELRGVHRGDQAVSRRQSFSARVVAETLRDLSRGMTYGEASLRARERTGRTVTRTSPASEHTHPRGTRVARNAWHIAADWTETYGPVLWDHLDTQLRRSTTEAVARRDELRGAGTPDPEPLVVLVDDVPFYAAGADDTGAYVARREYFVLTAAEIQWGLSPRASIERRIRLRLARAMPASDRHCWKLLFDELGYTPDVIVSDAGKGILKGVDEYYAGQVVFVPSLFHVRRAVELGLYETPGAWTRASQRAPKELRPDLADMTGRLTRRHMTTIDPGVWSAWWNDLEALLRTLGLPIEKTRSRRLNYEERYAAALPTLAALPQLPLSTGGLEVAIRKRIDPIFAAGRHRGFSNIERTNRLLDLVVCDDHRLFDDITVPVELIRNDSVACAGWSTPLRQIADPQPAPRGPGADRYSSLRDHLLVRSMARAKGLT
jgi:hypothetical protein